MSVWVCGEALIDIFGEREIVGGGPANSARALALLGHEVEFIGGISTDPYGRKVLSAFTESKVGVRHSLVGDQPTCTASVTFNDAGSASYAFNIAGTITFDFGADWLPDPAKFKPSLLYIGTLATVVEPGATNLFEWAKGVAEFAPIIFDPNVRPLVLSDRETYRSRVEPWLEISTVVKISEDDLRWLYPVEAPEVVGARWVEMGIPLVVITHGAAGITAMTSTDVIFVESVSVDVVDTIGAGDTVGAIVVDAILETGIVNLHGDRLREMLYCACVAAAITCSRAGAQPPTKSELTAALEKGK